VGPDVEIETDTQQGLWWTLCDQNQLENSLLNLVINARDAMPDGGKLTIRTQNVSMEQAVGLLGVNLKPGDYVVLSVTDSGTGMTPDVIEHAFEPFFTTKPFGEGTGLGLAMIHGFANQSGGCVTIDSEVGRGTTISLYLPKHVAGQDAMPESTVQSEGLLPATNRQNLTVLVVDDELPVRTMLVEMLRQFGHDPLEAADGHDGLQMLETHPRIGLLITDIGLPGGMNGRQLSNLARVLRPDLKILFITGYAEQSVIGKDTLPPGMQILTKPFTMETLDNAVRSMIDSPRIDPV
jgi:CheY-like chemotaxis protein